VKRVLSLVVALGVAALFGSATLAGAECNYHKTQAAVSPSSSTTKDVATASDNGTTQVKTAQMEQPSTPAPAPEAKK
jgi:hypothetical protein